MKYISFSRRSKLTLNRFNKILEHTRTLCDVQELTEAHKQRALSLYEETLEKHKDFEKNLEKLLSDPNLLDETEETEVQGVSSAINDLCIEIRTNLRPLLPSNTNQNDTHNTSQSNTLSTSGIRLPKIQLKTFNGDISQWIAFYNLFDTTVHKNQSLTNIEKFQFLLSSLQYEPLNLIKSLPLTNDNYTTAYDILIKRYHNPRILQSLHLNQLIDMPTCHDIRPNAKNMRTFICQFNEHASALNSLGINVQEDNPILITLLLRKFDLSLRTRFETKRNNSHDLPTPKEFIEFLENECSHMENACLTQSSKIVSQKQPMNSTFKSASTRNKNVTLTVQADTSECSYCKGDHLIYQCSNFLKIKPEQRFIHIKTSGLCINCLRGHRYKDCKSNSTCKQCNKRHNTLLHFKQNSSNSGNTGNCSMTTQPVTSQHTATSADTIPLHSVHTMNTPSQNKFITLLGTTLVKLIAPNNNTIIARALIDCASSCSFINEDIASKLKIKREFSNQSCNVNGISCTSVKTKGKTYVDLLTLNNKEVYKSLPVFILDKITGEMPYCDITPEIKERLLHFKLADPNFDKKGPIQMLIGADILMQIIKPAKYSLGENMPYALDTEFGFIIIGKASIICTNSYEHCDSNVTTLFTVHEDPLHKLITQFWQVEQPPDVQHLTPDIVECENHFQETHSRCPVTGKYVVRLPFKQNPELLGDSSNIAKRRFLALENKLNSQPEFKRLYCDFMNDYLNEGHMELCGNVDAEKPHYFLPHHGVFKHNSTTTRLRVVFDASCKTTNNVSLNQLLHVGPKLHNDISTIITNFRRYRYVFTSDVKQMFRSIDLDERDKCYQLIFWRDNPQKQLSVYRLNTVTYGMASSPYLANRVVQQLTEDEKDNHPLASAALKHQIYVDDLVLGHDNLEEALKLQHDVIQLLRKGNFHLRKWTANHLALLSDIPTDYQEKPIYFRTPDQPLISILGLQWIPNTDCFTYKINISKTTIQTKRTVLSSIAKLYDPCGFLSPVIFSAKSLIQLLWTLGCEWDTPLPKEIVDKWNTFLQELPVLETLSIPRHLGVSEAINIQLHGFCDASELGYSSCVYLRTCDTLNNVKISLILAKSKVAPLKHTSLPRLELCGAYLLSQLMRYCITLLSKTTIINSVHAWTDSKIVLCWISTPPYKLKTFVANRVAHIQDWLQPALWSHVPSSQNPADCASRGLQPTQLIHHDIWWIGPSWLNSDITKWPKKPQDIPTFDQLPEFKNTHLNAFISTEQTSPTSDILHKYSSWNKLQRIISYLLRFWHNLTSKNKYTGNLSTHEIQEATFTICRLVQQSEFILDINNIKRGKQCSLRLQSLSPFVDDKGLIRVGGRLENASLNEDAKHPILLPKTHFVTNLIVDYYHLKYLHAGPQLLQSLISKQYWILSARSLIRSRIHKCIQCFRAKPPIVFPKMANLPEARTNPAPCFQKTGLDYAGPMDVKVHTLRRAQVVKAYLCLFVCFTTKAVHIEIATDLSTDTFVAALTRFISRRGLPSDVYLDNATNFVGAQNKLDKTIKHLLRQEVTKNKLNEISVHNKIKFHFIPPAAPHIGGLWESAVKSAKTHLRRVIGNQILTLEEFQTLTCRVEAILNSRPLTPLSADPSELNALTPGHFIIGRSLVSLPESESENIPIDHLKRWQRIQAMSQHIWKRWQIEYLHTLQQRAKWRKGKPNLAIGDLVIVHTPNTAPQSWCLGRITKTFPGKDGIIRVLEIKTAKGILIRPVVKVSPLPQQE